MKGKTHPRAFRSCEVPGTELIMAGGNAYATCRTDCAEHSGTRTFYYPPGAQMTLCAEPNHKRRGRSTLEFLEEL